MELLKALEGSETLAGYEIQMFGYLWKITAGMVLTSRANQDKILPIWHEAIGKAQQ